MINTVKFLCSYGGKIPPRHPDGKLRYTGGETRVVAVDRSISFIDLLFKLAELYGSAVSLRCQLPQYDLDALVSVTSNEDLKNVIEEYDLARQASGSQSKIRVFISPLKSTRKISASQTTSPTDFAIPKHLYQSRMASIHPIPAPIPFGICADSATVTRTRPCYYTGVSHLMQSRLVHTGNHWH